MKSRPVTKVTFRLPKAAALEADMVHLVGDFNNWSIDATPMTRLKNGEFKVCLDLETGREYCFRYLIGEETWENDWEADKYVPSGVAAEENSVVVA
ncbi:MAG: isoamylase early set domain-containing protein [Candidatus Krumholzibacteriota bacterium]